MAEEIEKQPEISRKKNAGKSQQKLIEIFQEKINKKPWKKGGHFLGKGDEKYSIKKRTNFKKKSYKKLKNKCRKN